MKLTVRPLGPRPAASPKKRDHRHFAAEIRGGKRLLATVVVSNSQFDTLKRVFETSH